MCVFLRPSLSGCSRGLFCFEADNTLSHPLAGISANPSLSPARIYYTSFFRGIIGHRSYIFFPSALLPPKEMRQRSDITNSLPGRVSRDSLFARRGAEIHGTWRIKHSPRLEHPVFADRGAVPVEGASGSDASRRT